MKEISEIYEYPMEKGTYLFHYTSIYAVKRILYFNQLRYSHLYKLNDIMESFRPVYLETDPKSILALNIKWKLPNGEFDLNAYEKFYKIIESYRQISFSMDIPNSSYRGYNLDNMWGLYGEKGNGVCLVFDKEKLLNKVTPKTYGAIEYVERYDNRIHAALSKEQLDIENMSSYIENNAKDIFFQKSRLWEHEQEYRIIKDCHGSAYDQPEYLDIGDALEAVILYVPYVSEHSSNIHLSINSMECIRKLCERYNVKLLYLVGIEERYLIDAIDWESQNIS